MKKKTADGLFTFTYCDRCEIFWADWTLRDGKVVCSPCKLEMFK